MYNSNMTSSKMENPLWKKLQNDPTFLKFQQQISMNGGTVTGTNAANNATTPTSSMSYENGNESSSLFLNSINSLPKQQQQQQQQHQQQHQYQHQSSSISPNNSSSSTNSSISPNSILNLNSLSQFHQINQLLQQQNGNNINSNGSGGGNNNNGLSSSATIDAAAMQNLNQMIMSSSSSSQNKKNLLSMTNNLVQNDMSMNLNAEFGNKNGNFTNEVNILFRFGFENGRMKEKFIHEIFVKIYSGKFPVLDFVFNSEITLNFNVKISLKNRLIIGFEIVQARTEFLD